MKHYLYLILLISISLLYNPLSAKTSPIPGKHELLGGLETNLIIYSTAHLQYNYKNITTQCRYDNIDVIKIFNNTEKFKHLAFLMGIQHKYRYIKVNLSGGIGYMKGHNINKNKKLGSYPTFTKYEEVPHKTITIPWNLKVLFTPIDPTIGIGIGYYSIFDLKQSQTRFSSIAILLELQLWSQSGFMPIIKNLGL